MARKINLDPGCGSSIARRDLLGRFTFVLAAIMLFAQSPACAQVVIPTEARTMTAFELFIMFRDKTWKWTDGAGRMQDEGRFFKALTQSGEDVTWAEGRWTVSDRGRLCLKATWHSQGGEARKTTCFSHRILGGTIYQKSEPAGKWYVFKHATPVKEDEFNRLVSEDLVGAVPPSIPAGSAQTDQIESRVDTVRPTSKAN